MGFLFFLTGCFQVEEWTTLKEDGSAAMTMKIRLGMGDKEGKGKSRELKEDLQRASKELGNVKQVAAILESKNGQQIVGISFEAPRLSDFKNIYRTLEKDKKDEKLFGDKSTFYQTRKTSKGFRVERTLLPPVKAKKKPKKKKKDDFGEIENMIFGGVFMRFSLTLPGMITAHNAEIQDGQTLHWVFPFQYLQTNKVILWADVQVDK